MITIQMITATDELMSFVTTRAGPPREGGRVPGTYLLSFKASLAGVPAAAIIF